MRLYPNIVSETLSFTSYSTAPSKATLHWPSSGRSRLRAVSLVLRKSTASQMHNPVSSGMTGMNTHGDTLTFFKGRRVLGVCSLSGRPSHHRSEQYVWEELVA
jgi:hypothetical protein